MSLGVFVEFALIFAIVLLFAAFARVLKQPLIIGYILAGIAVGPFFLNLVQSSETVSTLAQMGVTFLLFIVGISLNPKVIKEVGKVSLITGIGQVIFTSIIGFGICKLLGYSTLTSVYVSVALTFSSTIIIMKLLTDKRDLDTLYGKIAIGFLIVQDLIAILILVILSSVPSGENIGAVAIHTLLKIVIAIGILGIISWKVLPPVTRFIAKSQEFLLLFSIGWCFVVAAIFYYFNISIEAGALLAGVTLSSSAYSYEISSKIKPLRDFFIMLFFVLLGSQMTFANLSSYVIPIIVLSLFILVANPLIMFLLMSWLGYTKRNSFFTGLIVAQISEFSLVLVALGVQLGHVNQEILSLVTFVGLITIAGSTYLVLSGDKIYPYLAKYLALFERKGKKVDQLGTHTSGFYDVILFGYNRIGFDILNAIKKIGKKVLIVDYDPAVIEKLTQQGFDCKYGDVNDVEMLNELDFRHCKMAISTIPVQETNMLLIKKIKQTNKNTIIKVVSHQIDEAMALYDAGASYVIMPHFLGGKHISSMIEEYGFDSHKFGKEKSNHIKYLHKRRQVGHEHPKAEGLR
ncbi:cation:proton antiporter [Candidatus Woesearchaeota archaeon]|nr:cation:proton antiporter [Candidatus Woesearchaeota archaeon]